MRLIDIDKIRPMDFPSTDMDGMDVVNFLNTLPTIEAEPVRHGEWEFDPESYTWNCSECHDCEEDGCMDGSVLSNYCPNCGAKMDGAEREGSELNGGDALD